MLGEMIKEKHEERLEQVQRDLAEYGSEVLQSEEMKRAFEQKHHLRATVGEHTVRVAVTSLLVNIPAVVVGALCHDLGILGREEKYSSNLQCSIEHPKDSVEVAREIVDDLPDKTADIIERHMWPIGKSKVPNSLEGFIVSGADKYSSVKDLVRRSDGAIREKLIGEYEQGGHDYEQEE